MEADGHLDKHLDTVLIGGREPVKVTVAAYQATWPAWFRLERERIAAAFGAFRDWLRWNAGDRKFYERTKIELAERFWPDMNYYAEAKSSIIAVILERASSAQPLPRVLD